MVVQTELWMTFLQSSALNAAGKRGKVASEVHDPCNSRLDLYKKGIVFCHKCKSSGPLAGVNSLISSNYHKIQTQAISD